MKKINYFFIVMSSLLMMTMTSCVNNLEGNEDNLPSNVATVQEQVSAMKSSVLELESIQTKLSEVSGFEEYVALVEDCATSVKKHIASVENGLSGAYAAIAAMELQGQVADVAGTMKVALALAGNDDFQKDMTSLEKSVSAWLGKDFKNYFGVSAEQARLRLMLKTVGEQTIAVEALASDVEAGLRVGDASSLETTLASVNKSSASLSELDSKISSLSVEIEEAYVGAIKAEKSASKSALKTVNTKAISLLADAGTTLDDLASRISACELQIEDLKERLTKVEADIEKLLGMIQSVTFLSEVSEDKAIAYYTLNPAVVDPEGRMGRTPVETISLNYLVRPAAAVTALADMESWAANGLNVSLQGYLADMIEVKSFDKEFFDFTINSVTADTEKGILSISADSNPLTDDFFMKKSGAKLALSIKSATTDLASKFVEIVPRDQSGNVYVESLTLDARSLEIKQGDFYQLEATLSPSGVTVAGCDWSSSVPEIASIDENGKITANIQGTTVITATTKGTNEWGQKLTATCNVKVLPNAKILKARQWIEWDEEIQFNVEMSDNFEYTRIEWALSNNEIASIDNSGKLKGIKYAFINIENDQHLVIGQKYRETDVYCRIYNGGDEPEAVLTESMMIVANQPKGINIENITGNEVTLKFGQVLDLGEMSVAPAEVNTDLEASDILAGNTFYVTNSYVGSYKVISYDSGTVTAKSIEGDYTMEFSVGGLAKYWAPKHGITRKVKFTVEPYFVQTMTVNANINLYVGDTAQITPEFTSDISNVPPTDMGVVWSIVEEDGFDPTVVSLVGTTFTAEKVGTAKVRATTTGKTVDGDPITADCIIVVEEVSENAAKVGDYYYSDGTYSTTKDINKTVVGVVYAVTNATLSDTKLATEHPSCSHGLVVCTTEDTKQVGSYLEYGNNSIPVYFADHSWPIPSTDVNSYTVMGYHQTKALQDYQTFRGSSDYLTFVGAVNDGPKFYFADGNTNSGWYIPSYKEMSILRENMSTVNETLTTCGGTQISGTGLYFISTVFDFPGDSYNDLYIRPYNMSTGTWNNPTAGRESTSTTYTARLVLAF